MRRTLMLALATAIAAVAVPTGAHYLTRPVDDYLGATLRAFGFMPITPPSNLLRVGSLYWVDAKVKDFKPICHAEKADLEGAVDVSRSVQLQENLERNGRLVTGVTVDLGARLNGDGGNNYQQTVHYTLTDVFLEEISLGQNDLIFAKLMAKPECNRVAMRNIDGGGYVCQVQKILQATAEFKLDRDTQSNIATHAKTIPDEIKGIVKVAIETQSNQSVVERQGRLLAGSALNYGVSMNPTCLAPRHGRFQRVLPKTVFDRLANLVLFSVIEPIWPGKEEQTAVAELVTAGQGW